MLTERVYIGLGSNLGDRAAHLQAALLGLHHHVEISVVTKSTVIETQPVGNINQGNFLNMVVEVVTSLTPRGLLDVCLMIEQQEGRKRGEKWGPRTLDIDVLLFGDLVLNEEGMHIPHPEFHKRQFVLIPLAEIAPDCIHPVTGEQIGAMLHQM